MMRTSVFYSVGLHALVVSASIFGLPHMRKPPPMIETPIVVEVVEVAVRTNLPTARPEPPKKKPKPKEEAKKESKKPPPRNPTPTPPPPSMAVPPKELAALSPAKNRRRPHRHLLP